MICAKAASVIFRLKEVKTVLPATALFIVIAECIVHKTSLNVMRY